MKRMQVLMSLVLVGCLAGLATAGGFIIKDGRSVADGYVPIDKMSGRDFVKRTMGYIPGSKSAKSSDALARALQVVGDTDGEQIQDELQNDKTKEALTISLDRKDKVYYAGDSFIATVTTRATGYLYLFNVQVDGTQICLFPNSYQKNNRILANQSITVPAPGASYRIRVNAPYGEETLVAVLAEHQVSKESIKTNSLTDAPATEVKMDGLPKALSIQGENSWASASTVFTTKPSSNKPEPVGPYVPPGGKKRRIGLFIGINEYEDNRIPDLSVCDRDASMMAKVMVDQCGLDMALMLLDEQATLAAIKSALSRLATESRPGDEVFLYWSGHGGTCADTGGDEADGRDEYLVPCDGRFGTNGSMMMDDDFDEFILRLNGRQLVVILDTCHSGGISGAQKSIGTRTIPSFDFIGEKSSQVPVSKDISANQAAMLCSSTSEQISLERAEGDVSVMTYFVLAQLQDPRITGLTFKEMASFVTRQVPIEIEKKFPGLEQTPFTINKIGTIMMK